MDKFLFIMIQEKSRNKNFLQKYYKYYNIGISKFTIFLLCIY